MDKKESNDQTKVKANDRDGDPRSRIDKDDDETETQMVARIRSDMSNEHPFLPAKGIEMTNLNKPSTSRTRPVSPPPRSRRKMKQQEVISSTHSHSSNNTDSLCGNSTFGLSDRCERVVIDNCLKGSDILPETSGRKEERKCTASINNFLIYSEDEDDAVSEMKYNPSSTSVLVPAQNPYNKQERIREANIQLFKEVIREKYRTRIKFNDIVSYVALDPTSDTDSALECSIDDYHASERRTDVKYDFDLFKEESEDNEEDTSVDSNDELENNDWGEDENEKRKSAEPIQDRVLESVNLNIPKESSNKVLLVMVPDASTVEDLVGAQSDYSSSENEDVCFGHSRKEQTQMSQENRNKTTLLNDHIDSNTLEPNIIVTEDNKEKDKKQFTEEYEHADNYDNGCTENKELNINLIGHKDINKISVNSYSENISISPKNNTGIKIKITCPDCCDKYSELKNKAVLDELDSKICVESEHDCEYDTKSGQQFKSSVVKTDTKNSICRSDLKSDLINSAGNKRNRGNEQCVKNSITNISISLHTLKDFSVSSRKNKYGLAEGIADKRQSTFKNEKNLKTSVVNGRKVAEQFLLKTKHEVKSKKSNINKKENEKQSKLLICNSFRKTISKSDLNSYNTMIQTRRPRSCSFEQMNKMLAIKRPETAPVTSKRNCSVLAHVRLPRYNGFRSEYGLTEEQLLERKRLKHEKMKMRRQRREEILAEEERKRKENEETFSAWLTKKNELAKKKRMQTQMYPGSTIRRYSAPTNHLLKNNSLQWKSNSAKLGRNFSVDKLLNDATPQEKRTYRIYLGLGAK